MSASASQKNLYEHSEAKVSLYGHYLSIYLNVLARSPIKNIHLFDLFCGEGIYEDGGKGSPIIGLETIKNHYYSNNNTCPNIFVTLNDSEYSEIEIGKLKIDRVKEKSANIFIPPTVKVGFSKIDYTALVPKVIERANKLKSDERALIFIDPWGYKEIHPIDIKNLLQNGKTEVLLFLPIYFMSRFANKSKDENYSGGRALRKFLGELFGSMECVPEIESQQGFIFQIQEQFKKYLDLDYIDSFKIERENNQWFCLFFFTPHPKGFHKMIEAKWKIDKKRGDGFKIGDCVKMDLFSEIELSKYDAKVLDFLENNRGATNQDLKLFGLKNNFLPTHTKGVLNEIKKNRELEILSMDGKAALSYYLGDDTRLVNIRLKK